MNLIQRLKDYLLEYNRRALEEKKNRTPQEQELLERWNKLNESS